MSNENRTKVTKVFTLSSYTLLGHRTKGDMGDGEPSFAESLSPLHEMIDSFRNVPLGTKITVTMEEQDK